MKAQWGVTAGATLIVCAVATGCGSSPDSKASALSSPVSGTPSQTSVPAVALYQSPEQATLSWFSAIDHKDRAAVLAHFTTAAANQMGLGWTTWDTSAWPTFSALHCRQLGRSAATASVYCTFKESQAPSVGNPDSFWTVYLQRQADGRWLITNYGQG